VRGCCGPKELNQGPWYDMRGCVSSGCLMSVQGVNGVWRHFFVRRMCCHMCLTHGVGRKCGKGRRSRMGR